MVKFPDKQTNSLCLENVSIPYIVYLHLNWYICPAVAFAAEYTEF